MKGRLKDRHDLLLLVKHEPISSAEGRPEGGGGSLLPAERHLLALVTVQGRDGCLKVIFKV